MRDGSLFLNFLSDFWTTVWQDKQLLSAAIGAQTELLYRMYLQAVRAAAPDFIDSLSLFQEDFWNLITFEEGTLEARAGNEPYKYALAARYEAIPFLYNKMFNPTLVLREGVHYELEQAPAGQDAGEEAEYTRIVFAEDPFLNTAYPISQVGQSKAILFFAPKVLVDADDLEQRFGDLVKIVKPSSEQYRQLIKGAMSLYARGPILFLVNAGLNLAAGYPVARENDRIIGITRTVTHHVIRTVKNLEYRIPIAAELIVDVDSEIRVMETFIKDIRVMDYISEPEWWKGGPTNTVADERVVNYLPESLVPVLALEKRDDPDVIDHLFNTYLKYHVFGMRVNTLALQSFDAVEQFFGLVFDVKPSYTSPYVNSFFLVKLVFDLPDDSEIEAVATIALTRGLQDGDTADYADYFTERRNLALNSLAVLNSDPSSLFDTAHDQVTLGATFELTDTHRIEGGQDILNSGLIMGAAFPDGIRELPTLGATIDLEEEQLLGDEGYTILAYDEDTGVTTEIIKVTL
jgi:hypothetical protein